MTEPTTDRMGVAEVHRRIVELTGVGRYEEALALIASDVVDHRGGVSGDHYGLDAWKDKWEHMDDGFRDVSVTIEQNLSSNEFSVNRYTIRGTLVASGRRYEVTGIDMVRIRDGKLAEHWALIDAAGMRHQLGLGGSA
ncbi:ester cyclase [Nocardia sp. NBC_00565]|uniref:ester cyclase n=1 Tax=Nocardia sp. NBC_00565 TaxID=2975993 RepID=UPI002E81B2E1|nr:ester cyclase [Nocardia sp. NBC_00565]WUC06537.1 ester cyclase [Nocardia sp. NBC_00565]